MIDRLGAVLTFPMVLFDDAITPEVALNAGLVTRVCATETLTVASRRRSNPVVHAIRQTIQGLQETEMNVNAGARLDRLLEDLRPADALAHLDAGADTRVFSES
jgi:enoyl-CoA hydratase/carnithine racemase